MIDFWSIGRSSVPLIQCVGMMGRNGVCFRAVFVAYYDVPISHHCDRFR